MTQWVGRADGQPHEKEFSERHMQSLSLHVTYVVENRTGAFIQDSCMLCHLKNRVSG